MQGIQGPQGEPFTIKKTYSSVVEMQADFDNMEVNDYVMIATSVETPDNAKMYVRGEEEWIFITDFSGATGIQGPQGIQGIQGEQGIAGQDGYSPTVTTSKSGKTTTITITDVNGVHTATIQDGQDGTGVGDMTKAVYDTNDNGIVDNAELVNNHTVLDDVPSNLNDTLEVVTGSSKDTKTITESDQITNAISISDLQLQGNTYQQTYTGKNLCGIPDQTVTFAGITITIKDGEITLNGTTTSTGTTYINPIKSTVLNGTYVNNYIFVSGSKTGSGTVGNFNVRNADNNNVISGTQLALNNSNSKAGPDCHRR